MFRDITLFLPTPFFLHELADVNGVGFIIVEFRITNVGHLIDQDVLEQITMSTGTC